MYHAVDQRSRDPGSERPATRGGEREHRPQAEYVTGQADLAVVPSVIYGTTGTAARDGCRPIVP